ncbi:MAG: 50S ribosomal protein L4 [Arcobacter sp.]|jgi:large subunit ribosomal protein L4|uniref:Large ribosomal subunit protein uL4 n=1 Tax=Arcobacter defluvii TaxID=873191 RepID=A0AAE7BF78_9BACT|nr:MULTISPECIES: 50S ribosomal protein L4 [Arcobacter]MDY3200795.1 50S ribosomal protein L4 [Arcobacter sp.]QKF76947.1 50S ribosomal protein L4 [Arcobacter defluvii]RXI33713.1 50S ribosomal protein L4 [Arcobacter defluvii]BAK72850.1 50S ribosomal protein L4 [Arcobacter sp. L]
MSKAIVLNEKFENNGEVVLPASYEEINSHNLYLYVKSYLAALRSNTARAKTRAEVSGGGKKPKAQKGSGAARWGSKRSPLFVGGGQAFGPTKRNYNQKVNKKQKALALKYAINAQANNGSLFVVDSLKIESGKTKEAVAVLNKLNKRDTLIVCDVIDEKTYLAFRNIKNCYMVEKQEVNAYIIATYHSVLIEKSVLDALTKEA